MSRYDAATTHACLAASRQYGRAWREWLEDDEKMNELRRRDATPEDILAAVLFWTDRLERARAAELMDPEPKEIKA